MVAWSNWMSHDRARKGYCSCECSTKVFSSIMSNHRLYVILRLLEAYISTNSSEDLQLKAKKGTAQQFHWYLNGKTLFTYEL